MFLLLQKICENVDVSQPTPKRATRKQKKQATSISSDISMQSKESSNSESSNINSPEKKKLRSKMKPIRLLESDGAEGTDSNHNSESIQQTIQPDNTNDVQGESAQYHEDSTPADSAS
jgi:hypothetical protein